MTAVERRGPTTPQLVGLLLAVAFAAGSLGFAFADRATKPPDADVGFLRDMIVHHEQAIEMSASVIGGSLPSGAQSYVVEIISDQRYEVGLMETILRRWDVAVTAPDDRAMAWMGDAVASQKMPGMATTGELSVLRDVTGAAAAEEWFRLMSRHHVGGLQMAAAAADRVQDRDVRALATRIARNQRIEINEYASAARRLGVAVPDVDAELAASTSPTHGEHP